MGKGNTQVALAALTSPPSHAWRTQSRTGRRSSPSTFVVDWPSLPSAGDSTCLSLGLFAEGLAAGNVQVKQCSSPGFDFPKAWRATGTVFGFTIAASMSEDRRTGWAEHLAATPTDAANPMLAVFNLTGHSAVSLPVATSANGLPIGFQLVGKPWREMDRLAAAGRLCPDPAPRPELD